MKDCGCKKKRKAARKLKRQNMYNKINEWIVAHIYPIVKKVWIWLKKYGWQFLNFAALLAIFHYGKDCTASNTINGVWLLALAMMYTYTLFKMFTK